ncbi:MAG: SIMPL domain-containing protein [Bacteroidales bacterium]|nr:SIMPL domain-containing protein [Bacteroidales bacterium]
MKKLYFIFLTVLSLNCFSQSGTKNFIDQNYIEVIGKAELKVVPDEIYLKIIIQESDFKGKIKLENLEKSMINKLSKIGVNVKTDLSIKDMSSNFKNYWLKSNAIYSMKEYELKVKKAQKAGEVFQELEKLGISNITIDRIDHSQINKYKTNVKLKAIKIAKKKAILMTESINQSIGKAIYIQELNTYPYRKESHMVANMSMSVRGFSGNKVIPEIEFEKIKLEYSVLMRFVLK